jgi:SAM-dependent methyltransferase
MANVSEHYENLLADHYSWIYGGFELQIENNYSFFNKHMISPGTNCIAVDLGAGSGFQSIPLAKLGFQVTAVDLSRKLLEELNIKAEGLIIKTIADDLLNFPAHIKEKAGLIVCMGDTLTHLNSKTAVTQLFEKVYLYLNEGGTFILTFRDLISELHELDRFIPVRSDDKKIFTCFLEYGPEYVKVHDLVYERSDSGWNLKKSCYNKCRIDFQWCKDQLINVGLKIKFSSLERNIITVIAEK